MGKCGQPELSLLSEARRRQRDQGSRLRPRAPAHYIGANGGARVLSPLNAALSLRTSMTPSQSSACSRHRLFLFRRRPEAYLELESLAGGKPEPCLPGLITGYIHAEKYRAAGREQHGTAALGSALAHPGVVHQRHGECDVRSGAPVTASTSFNSSAPALGPSRTTTRASGFEGSCSCRRRSGTDR